MNARARRLVIALVLAACGQTDHAFPTPVPTPSPAPPPVPAVPAPVPPPPVAEVATSAIGLSGSPAPPTAEARRANAEALKLHRAGNVREARAGFERAVALAPSYAMARFNLACALSRLGEFDLAARALEPLLEQDLPTFARRLRDDPDLAPLRAAPAGARLAERTAALSAAWARAAREGVPAVWVEDRLDVRPGVYLHAARRFVPLGPDEHDTLAALYDPASARSVYLVAVPSYDGISHLGRARVLVHAAEGSATPTEWRGAADFCGLVEAAATHTGASLLAFNCFADDAAPPTRALELGPGGARVTWQGTDGRGRSASTTGATISASALLVRLASGIPEGFSVRGTNLVVPGRAAPIALGRGHAGADVRSIVLSPARDVAVVVSVHAHCDCENDSSVERHVVERVTLATGSVESLSQGPRMAAALFGPDGALYVQNGDALRRWASPSATTPETLPAGILLGVLRFASGDCCSA